jgi:predicted phosphodiesterase
LAPARIAVVSDIHGNRQAFEAVLEEVGARACDEIWCLGDLVGYGAEPDQCVALAAERAAISLAGNHDLAVSGVINVNDFSSYARTAALWTREHASPGTLAYLDGLAPLGSRAGIGLYHASPRDPIWEYVLETSQASACLKMQPERVALIGHSHVALAFWQGGAAGAEGRLCPAGERIDWSEGRWLLNPGSVGQPRDGDNRAAWLELDLTAQTATYHRCPYDIEGAIAAIRAAGLPSPLGERLRLGE